MPQPLVIAYHLIWTAYGWWLPNDPRGSGSHAICRNILGELGELHLGRKKVQPAGRVVREFYQQAADRLKHPLLSFDEAERQAIADAFAEVINEQRYTRYACALMPDHVHILIRKHKHIAEEMTAILKEASRKLLITQNLRAATHPVWTAGDGWSVFQEHPDDIRRTMAYIERNPPNGGLPTQHWPYVKPHDNWPLYAGHSPNSPYAHRLREAGRYP